MSEFLAEASVLIRPNTAGFRATLVAELTKATAGIVVPIPVVAKATGTQKVVAGNKAAAVSAGEATVATEKLNVSRTKQIIIDQEAAAEEARLAAAQRKSAAAHEQFARGAGASVLSLGGIRGATLAASSGFLIGAAAVTVAAKSVRQFSQEQEAAARVAKILGGELGAGSEKWAKTLAQSFGIADDEALKFEGAIAEVLHNVNVLPDANQKLSESLVQLAADVGAFNNASTGDVLRAFQLALSGNLRGLRQFVPGVTAATVAQRALRDSGKEVIATLTQQELVLARAAEIQDKASNQVGTFAERSKTLSGQTKILSANIQDLADKLGKLVSIPILGIEVSLNKLFTAGQGANKPFDFGNFAAGFSNLGAAKDSVDHINASLEQFAQSLQKTSSPNEFFLELVIETNMALVRFSDAIRITQTQLNQLSFANANSELDKLQRHFLDLTFTGASSATKIADLQAQIAAAQKIIRNPAVSPTSARGKAAAERRNAAQAEIKNIRAADKAAAEQNAAAIRAAADAARQAAENAASLAKQAAADAQAQLDAQDQNLLTKQQFAQGDVEIAKLRAQHTTSLVDDLAALKLELRVTNAQIIEARKIHDANLRKQTIQSLTLASIRAQNDITQTEAQIAQNTAQRRAEAFSRAAESIDLDISLAQTQKNKQAEIAARQRRIDLDQQRLDRLKSVRGDINAIKRLRNDIAEQNAAIKALRKEVENRNKESASLAFAFLQTQSGFASSILSNLLPTGSVAGTVGGTSTGISTPTIGSIAAGGPQRPPDVGAGLGKAAAVGARGSTAGQMASLIQIQRHMLTVLLRLAGQNTHPESTTHRAWSWAQNLSTGW